MNKKGVLTQHYITIILMCMMITCSCLAQQKVLYKVRRITTADGLPSNTVHAMLQDKYGFVWIGGTNGLTRYDGYRFVDMNQYGDVHKTYTPKHIGLLNIDDTGNFLWTCTSTYHYGCYDLRRGHFFHSEQMVSQEFNKRFYAQDGAWLYDTSFGVRYFRYGEQNLRSYDFTVNNKLLPSNNVATIKEDAYGRKWIATSKGIVVVESFDVSKDKFSTKRLLIGKHIISCSVLGEYMVCLSKNDKSCYVFDQSLKQIAQCKLTSPQVKIEDLTDVVTWHSTCFFFTNSTTFQFDLQSKTFNVSQKLQVSNGYCQGRIDGYQLVANREGSLWLLPPKGEMRKIVLQDYFHSTNEKNKIYSFTRDKRGVFFIATYGMGLFTYDFKTNELLHYTAEDDVPLISSNNLLNIFCDASGCIWVSVESAGISCIQPITELDATYYFIDSRKKGDWTNYIRNLFYEKDGQLHVSTKDKQLYRFDKSSSKFIFEKRMTDGIYAYLVDSKGHEWVCTRGDGLYLDGMRYAKDGTHLLPSNDYYDICEDQYGRIWIATWKAGLLMGKVSADGKFLLERQFLNRDNNENKLHDLELAPDGNLYIATYNGLYAVDTKKQSIDDRDFVCYNTENDKFPNNEVRCLKYSNGYLWAGVVASGVVRCDFKQGLQNMSYSVFGQKEGLVDNDVASISSDRYGRLWIGGGSGLSCLNPQDNSVQRYELGYTIGSNVFSENGSKELSNGDIYFGTENGLLRITPKRPTNHSTKENRAFLTDFLINGVSIYEEKDSLIFDSALYATKDIHLSYQQNSVTICFSNLNFKQLSSQLYQVMLEGVDKDWGRPTTLSYVNYRNLSPGRYLFRVRTLNGNERGEETTLKIIIAEPWYNTWLAWMIYTMIIGLISYYVFRNAKERAHLHRQMIIEKEMTEFRLNFFTHVTHEFRTPLAIIQNAVSQLQDPISKTISKNALQTAQRGVNRLLLLVNQLMEFRKLSTGNVKLGVSRGDIIECLRQVWFDLWSIANQKKINYIFTPFKKQFEMLYDYNHVETILYNLLSNALKYTPTKGTISVKITHDEVMQHLIVTVEDSGPGVAEEQMKELFKPFMHGYVSRGGMGIGLYNAYQLAKLHHGDLSYKRMSDQGGACFTLILPTDSTVYTTEEYNMLTAINTDSQQKLSDNIIVGMLNADAYNKQIVAIIEDDPDMMRQIQDTVGTYFKTIAFMNGKEGYEGVLREKPNMVICDAMLPDMNGYDIIKRIKEDKTMKHIPVIMLTALDDEEHQIKGYQAGADDYMVKPCNFRLLIARIIQLIKWQQQQAIEKNSSAENPSDILLKDSVADVVIESRADKKFKENVQMLVVQHMSEPDFSVDVLAQKMCMGRSKFYGKMKEIYGMSPNKYIMGERMRVAAELLIEGKLNIAEISVKIGFTDPSYLNKTFKSFYGVSPSKYKG